MFATQIVLDPTSPQVWAGNRIRDRALLRDDADVFCAIDKNLVPRQPPVAFVETRAKVVEEFLQLGDKAFWKIADLSADAGVGRGEPGAGQKLEKVVEFFALRERLQKNRNRAERFYTEGTAPAPQTLHRDRVVHIIRERHKITEPVGIRHELVVLHVL